jgi:hypothetical protein
VGEVPPGFKLILSTCFCRAPPGFGSGACIPCNNRIAATASVRVDSWESPANLRALPLNPLRRNHLKGVRAYLSIGQKAGLQVSGYPLSASFITSPQRRSWPPGRLVASVVVMLPQVLVKRLWTDRPLTALVSRH